MLDLWSVLWRFSHLNISMQPAKLSDNTMLGLTLVQNRFFFGQHTERSGLGPFIHKLPEAFKTPYFACWTDFLVLAKDRLQTSPLLDSIFGVKAT
jgi:hypothetical protein